MSKPKPKRLEPDDKFFDAPPELGQMATGWPTALNPQRKSIPTQEVAIMLEKQREELQHKPTLYDKRQELVRSIETIRGEIRNDEERLTSAKDYLAAKQTELKTIDASIRAELDEARRQ